MGKDALVVPPKMPESLECPINLSAYRLKVLQRRRREIVKELKSAALHIDLCKALQYHLDTDNPEICEYQLLTLIQYLSGLYDNLQQG